MNSFIIITGASKNHSRSLIQFLNALYKDVKVDFKCVVYDLGLKEAYSSIEALQKKYNFTLRVFDYSKYPSYFQIEINAGEYAWKPIIIEDAMNQEKRESILLWCDSGNIVRNNMIPNIKKFIELNHIYTPIAGLKLKDFTHRKTLDFFHIYEEHKSMLDNSNRNGAIIGFNLNIDSVRDFIKEFARCALIKECIAPEGSNRRNHRQDQSILTILFYLYVKKYPQIQVIKDYLGIKIHQDCD